MNCVTPSRRILLETSPLYYPFGNTRFKNVFESIEWQIGGGQQMDVIKVLFLGCGDLRNTFQATSPTKHNLILNNFKALHVHLNDVNSSVLARNVLLLKIISASNFNPNDQDDITFLWDVWYNSEWPAKTRMRFQQVMKDLLNDSLPENVIISKSGHLQSLRAVWSAWSSISSKNESEAQSLAKKVNSQRACFIMKCWHMLSQNQNQNFTNADINSSFPKTVEGITNHFMLNSFQMEDLHDNFVKQKIRDEVSRFFTKGSCRLQNGVETVCLNPTMLNPTLLCWNVHYALSPFDGYLPLSQEELDTSVKDGILLRSCQKILKSLVTSYRKRMDDVKIFFHLEDALEFCYTGTTDMFDLIDCSNLSDHVGLANLINAASGRLSDAPGAVLFTESMNWRSLAPSVVEYVEEALCAPPNMIPTVYGLRLVNHIELGASKLVNLQRMMGEPANLIWQKAPPFRNVSLKSSPALFRCLELLALKCFVVKDTRKMIGTPEKCGMLCYTPLTFDYIVSSMIQRVGEDHWFQEVRDKLKIAPTFRLNQRTIEAWKKGQTVVKCSTDLNLNSSSSMSAITYKRLSAHFGTPILRLVFLPHGTLAESVFSLFGQAKTFWGNIQNGLSAPDVHYVDNVQLEVTKSAGDEIESVSISYLMVPDHGLEETHLAYVLDLMTGYPVFYLESIPSLCVEKCQVPYPIRPRVLVSCTQAPPSQMVVDSCVESNDQYSLKISIGCDQNISGLKVSTDQEKPCESAHQVTLSLSQPDSMQPLVLSFPHPVLVDNIRATLHRKDRFVDLILTKATREPWPCEFQPIENSKFSVERFKPWEDKKKNSLAIHLSTQFNITVLMNNPSELMTSALNEVREIIKTLFVGTTVHGRELFAIQRRGKSTTKSSSSAEWYVRAHLPIRTTSAGSPILLLSVVDNRLAERLSGSKKLDKEQSLADFTRIFAQHLNASENLLTTFMNSEEEVQLWRYVLRLNSTKMVPSAWQKKNLPLGENSPWLATFVVPLYNDSPVNKDGFELEKNNNAPVSIKPTARGKVDEKGCCASCKEIPQNLKRCSRCRAIDYCSVECQRAHWPQHKIVCSKN